MALFYQSYKIFYILSLAALLVQTGRTLYAEYRALLDMLEQLPGEARERARHLLLKHTRSYLNRALYTHRGLVWLCVLLFVAEVSLLVWILI